MAGASRKTDTTNTDAVDMEEMNPVWLKDKGMWVCSLYNQHQYSYIFSRLSSRYFLWIVNENLYKNPELP